MHTHTNMHNAMCVYLSWAYYELNQSKDMLTSKHVGNKEKWRWSNIKETWLKFSRTDYKKNSQVYT